MLDRIVSPDCPDSLPELLVAILIVASSAAILHHLVEYIEKVSKNGKQ